jgi:hypothetical protein
MLHQLQLYTIESSFKPNRDLIFADTSSRANVSVASKTAFPKEVAFFGSAEAVVDSQVNADGFHSRPKIHRRRSDKKTQVALDKKILSTNNYSSKS